MLFCVCLDLNPRVEQSLWITKPQLCLYKTKQRATSAFPRTKPITLPPATSTESDLQCYSHHFNSVVKKNAYFILLLFLKEVPEEEKKELFIFTFFDIFFSLMFSLLKHLMVIAIVSYEWILMTFLGNVWIGTKNK